MSEGKSCACSGAKTLIFACSGAADVGEIADRDRPQALHREGRGKMYCMAGIGARIGSIVKTTEAAEAILAIDGCPLNCASRCLQETGFPVFKSSALADLGMDKGVSPATNEAVERAVEAVKALLSA